MVKPKQIIAVGVVTSAVMAALVMMAPATFAQATPEADGGADSSTTDPRAKEKLKCGVLPQSICDSADNEDLEDSGIWQILLLVLNIMTVGVGVVSVGAIAYAGFLYASAQDNAAQTKKALEMIRNTAIGILVFALMYSIIQFLVPGGIFSSHAPVEIHLAMNNSEGLR